MRSKSYEKLPWHGTKMNGYQKEYASSKMRVLANIMFPRSWQKLKPQFRLNGGRCLPRTWLPWVVVCCCLLLMRLLWIRNKAHELRMEQEYQETVLADQTLSRHKQLQDRIESALEQKLSIPSKQVVPVSTFVLPVLIIACDRTTVNKPLDALLKYRLNLVGLSADQFPITVSHGCNHGPTSDVLKSYRSAINVVTFEDDSPAVNNIGRVNRGYRAVARHYKHALDRMFLQLNHSALIVVEDDLNVASDFFQYFAATLPILMANQNLFCVSAWNDNGRPGLIDPKRSDLLYRTDFFAGLGWMLLRSFWLEIRANWPDIFWDEYLRKPYVRKNRACLRPEIGRTTTFGRIGISRGQFFETYLSTMQLNQDWQNFLQMDLTYLYEPGYSNAWRHSVYNESIEVPLDAFLHDRLPSTSTTSTRRIRVTYTSQREFERIATKLNLMKDIKSGVMRNAFAGVVPVKWKDFFIYIAPPSTWNGYNESWS